MISDKKLSDKLKEHGKDVINTEQKFLASTFSNFISEIENSPLGKPLNIHATKQEEKDIKPLRNLEQKAFEKLVDENNAVEEYCKKHGIPIPTEKEIFSFRAFALGTTRSSDPMAGLKEAHKQNLDHLMRIEAKKNKSKLHFSIEKLKAGIFIINKNGQTLGYKEGISEEELHSVCHDTINFLDSNQILCKRPDLQSGEPHNHSTTAEILLTLSNSLYRLKTAHHRPFVEQFANLDAQGNILSLKIDPLIISYYDEKKRFDRLKTDTFWYVWKESKRFKEIHKNYEPMRQEARDKKDWLHESWVCDEFKKIEGIATGSQNNYMNEVKRWVKIIISTIQNQSKESFRSKIKQWVLLIPSKISEYFSNGLTKVICTLLILAILSLLSPYISPILPKEIKTLLKRAGEKFYS
jgi:hypothetical protein